MFLERVAERDDPYRDAERVLAALGEPGGHVVAQSYGAIAALLAVARAPESVWSLLLCEPACVSVARGRPAVEAHIRSLAPVFAVAEDRSVSDEEFARRFGASFASAHGAPSSDVSPDVLRAQGRRLRANIPPWAVTVPTEVVAIVPTLVVTGGREDMYGEIASALVGAGAQHLVVPGHGHRPQDDPHALSWLTTFWSANEREP
jgi:pimeloyl-ACP methyl ester carboxylesterase